MQIIKNLKPYWKSVLIIVLLLIVQAYCDLALPDYTSKLIDTGIQNYGIAVRCRSRKKRIPLLKGLWMKMM